MISELEEQNVKSGEAFGRQRLKVGGEKAQSSRLKAESSMKGRPTTHKKKHATNTAKLINENSKLRIQNYHNNSFNSINSITPFN